MIFLLVVVVGALATAGALRRSPARATQVGAASFGFGVVAATTAAATGNYALFYLSLIALPYGLVLLVVRLATRGLR